MTTMTATRGPGKPRSLSPEREAMVATLRRAGFGISSIADVFGISPRTLHAIFKREGVATKRRRRLAPAEVEEIRSLHAEGRSMTAIGARFQISRHTVARLVASAAPPLSG